MKWTNAFLLALLGPCFAIAQTTESTQKLYLDATPAGPFPIYFRLGPSLTAGHTDIFHATRLFNSFANADAIKPRNSGYGFSVDIGFKKKIHFFELGGYQYYRPSGGSVGTLSISNGIAVVRYGLTWSFYYPLALQFHGGVAVEKTDFTFKKDPNDLSPFTSFKVGLNNRFGFEVGTRFTVLDPADAGGGLGFSLGVSYFHFVNTSYQSMANQFPGPPPDVSRSGDFVAVTLTGIIPIALKLR